MDYREVRELLEKYWQGESTLVEEKQLRDFFSLHKEDLPPDLQQVAELFHFYEEEAAQRMGDISLPDTDHLQAKRNSKITGLKRYWKYAAIFILLSGSMLWYQSATHQSKNTNSVAANTYEDPEKAFEVTQKALQILAANLNKGKEGMQKIAFFHEAEQKVKKDDSEQ